METATPPANGRTRKAGGLHHANQVAAFDLDERQAAFAVRVMNCVSRAFDAIGASAETQEIIFWNLYVTRNLKRNEITDKPAEFIDGLRAIYGEAGELVFEYMMTKEIKSEFKLAAELDNKPVNARNLADLLSLIKYSALEPKSD